MDTNSTQRLNNSTVLYRCACGKQTSLEMEIGGVCPDCGRQVSPRALRHDLAMTMTIHMNPQEAAAAKPVVNVNAPTPELPADLIGKSYGHFQLIKPLGCGGMGHVYQALDTSLQRYVAVKILRSGLGAQGSTRTENHVESLLQEAVAQARVTHPNIVTIYYVGKEGNDPFLAMELVAGDALNKLISEDRLNFSDICSIGLQIAKALEFSFGLDIIHGDIKPGNVLIQPNGDVKLSDFGMARRASDDSMTSVGGTPNYLAPELLLSHTKPSIQSDMYALGVTLYEMTFGRPPIELSGTSVDEWAACHREQELSFPNPWPANLPDGWKALLERLLAPDPTNRFATYEELVAALEKQQPASRVPARRFPRLVGAFIDWATVLLLMAPLNSLLDSGLSYLMLHPLLRLSVELCMLAPMILYTIVLYFWRQSLGRHLMHLRVINQYNLQANGRSMLARGFIRMCVPWFLSISVFVGRTDLLWVLITATTIAALVVALWLVDVGCLLFSQRARSLHDMLFRTNVVVDTD